MDWRRIQTTIAQRPRSTQINSLAASQRHSARHGFAPCGLQTAPKFEFSSSTKQSSSNYRDLLAALEMKFYQIESEAG